MKNLTNLSLVKREIGYYLHKKGQNKLEGYLRKKKVKTFEKLVRAGFIKQLSNIGPLVNKAVQSISKANIDKVKAVIEAEYESIDNFIKEEKITEYITDVYNDSGNIALENFNISAVFDVQNPKVLEKLADRTTYIIDSVEETTKDYIVNTISSGVENNKSWQQIAYEIGDGYGVAYNDLPKPTTLPIDQLRTIAGTRVDNVTNLMPEGEVSHTTGPIEAFYDGKQYTVLDGYHRINDAVQLGRTEIGVKVISIEDLREDYPESAKLIERYMADPISDYRAELISRCETANAYNQAQSDFFRENGIKTKYWVTDTNPCEICEANAGDGDIPFNDVFSSGDDRPDAHPNCQCVLDTHDELPVDSGELWLGE